MARRSRSRLAFFLSLTIGLLLSCQNSPTTSPISNQPTPFQAFYHWQTEFALSQTEAVWLDSLQITKVYTKFFDLDWDPATASVIPLASVALDTAGLAGRQIIPTLFITNRSMLQIEEISIPQLANRIVAKIDRQFSSLHQDLKEVQLDCDWTGKSRTNFFNLLKHLASEYQDRGVELSATIRLHQLRYPDRTGVPPVKRGVLMFYNMGDLGDWEETNSILNLEKAASYLPKGIQYPLHLDLALPLFRWAILFRDGQMIKLINEPDESLLNATDKYRVSDSQRYEVIKSTYLDGYYLYEGDQLRIESISIEQLQAAVELIQSRFPQAAESLIWYHLDSVVLERYTLKDVETLRR